jgi:hypothetical protein
MTLKHPKSLGVTSKKFAKDFSQLDYISAVGYLGDLSAQYAKDASKDLERGRQKLSNHLRDVSASLLDAAISLDAAAKLSKPYMVDPLQSEFDELVSTWKRETAVNSNLSAIFLHPSHLRVIAMGNDALPLILKDFAREGGHWFAALEAISNTKMVLPERATHSQHRTAWIKWGFEQGLLSENDSIAYAS